MAEIRPFCFLAESRYADTLWRPSVDIYRGEEGWLIKCDLAGVQRDDIQTTLSGRRLTISGVRRDLTVIEGQRAYSIEIAYDRFERTIELPCDFDRAELEIDYREGMLLVYINPVCK
jgi:HSP20 family protein